MRNGAKLSVNWPIIAGCAVSTTALWIFISLLFRKPPLQPATGLDLSRYMGAWRILACTDNAAERKFVDAVENYNEDGDRINVRFTWRDVELDAPMQEYKFEGFVTDQTAIWNMHLFPMIPVGYTILGVGKDYDWAAVGHPSRKFGWILARETSLADGKYDAAMAFLVANAYKEEDFRRVLHPLN